MYAILGGFPTNEMGISSAHPPALFSHSWTSHFTHELFLHELHKTVDSELDEGGPGVAGMSDTTELATVAGGELFPAHSSEPPAPF